jgi:hypothetical protein
MDPMHKLDLIIRLVMNTMNEIALDIPDKALLMKCALIKTPVLQSPLFLALISYNYNVLLVEVRSSSHTSL